MTAAERAKLVHAVESGHPPESACAAMGIPVAALEKPHLAKLIKAAERIGIAKIRSKIIEIALEGDGDVRALERELERREIVHADVGITAIERRIIFKCEACGHQPEVTPAASPKPGNGLAHE